MPHCRRSSHSTVSAGAWPTPRRLEFTQYMRSVRRYRRHPRYESEGLGAWVMLSLVLGVLLAVL